MQYVCGQIKSAGILDFVSAWYIKAAHYVQLNEAIHCAFVSTNSITQGEQVGVLWSWMLAQGIKIHFAHRTFSWSNEARGKVAVHYVIIGFGMQDVIDKTIYEYADIKGESHAVKVSNINRYLVDAADLLLTNSVRPICNVPEIRYGSFALDDGNYTLSAEDRRELIDSQSAIEKYIRPFIGGQELIRNQARYCLWLRDIEPQIMSLMPAVLKRVEAVQKWRKSSDRKTTQDLATTPALFAEIRQPNTDYLALEY